MNGEQYNATDDKFYIWYDPWFNLFYKASSVRYTAMLTCTFMHERWRKIYTLTHLVGEFTTYKCGTKPQDYWLKVHCIVLNACAWHIENIYAILT